ncbi:hypothetical protein BD410DRAFT_80922 [Rickenella mellea]|uniref:Uncharacterized protein n=1 Tax=Rickenella mellea TaxID=50990 RepID=A0A4Y7PKB7_9AGAM|nr:hypothetical protein BD410DRAFT_80922 [Rickenella mellea]
MESPWASDVALGSPPTPPESLRPTLRLVVPPAPPPTPLKITFADRSSNPWRRRALSSASTTSLASTSSHATHTSSSLAGGTSLHRFSTSSGLSFVVLQSAAPSMSSHSLHSAHSVPPSSFSVASLSGHGHGSIGGPRLSYSSARSAHSSALSARSRGVTSVPEEDSDSVVALEDRGELVPQGREAPLDIAKARKRMVRTGRGGPRGPPIIDDTSFINDLHPETAAVIAAHALRMIQQERAIIERAMNASKSAHSTGRGGAGNISSVVASASSAGKRNPRYQPRGFSSASLPHLPLPSSPTSSMFSKDRKSTSSKGSIKSGSSGGGIGRDVLVVVQGDARAKSTTNGGGDGDGKQKKKKLRKTSKDQYEMTEVVRLNAPTPPTRALPPLPTPTTSPTSPGMPTSPSARVPATSPTTNNSPNRPRTLHRTRSATSTQTYGSSILDISPCGDDVDPIDPFELAHRNHGRRQHGKDGVVQVVLVQDVNGEGEHEVEVTVSVEDEKDAEMERQLARMRAWEAQLDMEERIVLERRRNTGRNIRVTGRGGSGNIKKSPKSPHFPKSPFSPFKSSSKWRSSKRSSVSYATSSIVTEAQAIANAQHHDQQPLSAISADTSSPNWSPSTPPPPSSTSSSSSRRTRPRILRLKFRRSEPTEASTSRLSNRESILDIRSLGAHPTHQLPRASVSEPEFQLVPPFWTRDQERDEEMRRTTQTQTPRPMGADRDRERTPRMEAPTDTMTLTPTPTPRKVPSKRTLWDRVRPRTLSSRVGATVAG